MAMDPAPQTPGIEIAPGVRVAPFLLQFSFASSSGPGGQNVNKRATKAELRIPIGELPISDDARLRLAALAGRRLTERGELVITSDEQRSQAQNRAACLERLRELLVRALVRPKRRRPTKPSRGSVERRLDAKRARSARKQSRQGGHE
jgi:ribosome-associated protein